MNKKLLLSTLIFTAFFFACQQRNIVSNDGLASFNKDSLALATKILSSDSFQGRKPMTPGEDITVSYLKTKMASIGLEPANGNSFTQDVPLVAITPVIGETMHIATPKSSFELKKTDDFVVSTESTDSNVSLTNDDLVFAGYGVVAPEYNWNDYAGLDVKGKVVLVLVNDPGFGNNDTTLFKGKTMTYYGRWTYKYEEAARQGAKACLIIHNTKAASYPFTVVQNSWSGTTLHLDKRGNNEPQLALEGWVTGDAAKTLLAAAGRDSSVMTDANKRGFKAIDLGLKLSLNVTTKTVYNTSHNVLGKITGSTRPDEYVIYTAHWDHFGIGKPDEKGDSIYHGAADNASGTAALLEMARAFKSMKTPPERTVIFIAVTGEEQGLLGSAYYTQHPVYSLKKTAANINMDVINVGDKTNDMIITGIGQNDLEDDVIAAAKQQGRYISPEGNPEGGHYYRSDHFNFAKVGVPALDCSPGYDVVGKGKEYGKKLKEDYTANRYHRPSDQFNPSWTFAGGVQDLQLLFMVGRKIADESAWPKWKDGSEFKAIRER